MNLVYDYDDISLRVLNEYEAERVLSFYNKNKEAFQKYETSKPANFYTLEFQQKLLAAEYQDFIHGKYIRLFLFNRNEPDKIIGTVSFSDMKRSAFFSCQIGYKIDSDYKNKGFGFKMLTYSIQILEQEWNMHRFEAYIFPDNLPSVRLIKKVGFEFEGIAKSYVYLNGNWTDHLRYVYISQNSIYK